MFLFEFLLEQALGGELLDLGTRTGQTNRQDGDERTEQFCDFHNTKWVNRRTTNHEPKINSPGTKAGEGGSRRRLARASDAATSLLFGTPENNIAQPFVKRLLVLRHVADTADERLGNQCDPDQCNRASHQDPYWKRLSEPNCPKKRAE